VILCTEKLVTSPLKTWKALISHVLAAVCVLAVPLVELIYSFSRNSLVNELLLVGPQPPEVIIHPRKHFRFFVVRHILTLGVHACLSLLRAQHILQFLNPLQLNRILRRLGTLIRRLGGPRECRLCIWLDPLLPRSN